MRRILLVEDEDAHVQLIVRAFDADAPRDEVVVAHTLADARLLLEESPPDIMLLDFFLPDGEGIDLLAAQKEDFGFPVVMMTSHGTEVLAVEAMKAGALDYVVKSSEAFAKMPKIADRVLREWRHISSREEAERHLAQSEMRFRALIEHSNDIIMETDAKRSVLYLSPSVQGLFICSDTESWIGRDLAELIHADDREAFLTRFDKACVTGSFGWMEHRILCSDGSARWLETRGSAYTLSEGDLRAVFMSRDVTERKRHERERVESETRLAQSYQHTVEVLADAMSAVDPYTRGHEQAVARLSVWIGRYLGLEEQALQGMRMAALLHDIGKIAIPQTILTKTGKLTKEEFALVKTHVERGREILSGVEFPWPEIRGIYEHHERLDGTGYPRGLRGDEISMAGRILAVADVVNSMTSHRPYRRARPVEDCVKELHAQRGAGYDPQVVAAALVAIEKGEVPTS